MDDHITPLARKHAAAAARLHREGIDTGFLSSLGQMFVKQIYAAIPSSSTGFGYVWEGPEGRPGGFIACCESTGRLFKQALGRRGILMALALLPRVIRHPSLVKRIIQTLRYPGEAGGELPSAELLSIAVDASARGKGVGRALVEAAFEECRRRGIQKIKVAVGAANETANLFYQRCGFTLAVKREHHGLPMNVYTADLDA